MNVPDFLKTLMISLKRLKSLMNVPDFLGGMRDESSKKSNPNGRRTQKSAHKRAEREPKSEEKKKREKTNQNEWISYNWMNLVSSKYKY